MTFNTNKISLKQKLFCRKLIELTGNQTDAYLAIYNDDYKLKNGKEMSREIATRSASRMLSTVDIYSYVEKLKEEALTAADISVYSVIANFKTWVDFDPIDIFDMQRVEILTKEGNSYQPKKYEMRLLTRDLRDIPPEVRQCIQSIRQGRDGFEIKMIDKLSANNALAKYLGLDKKTVEQSGNITLKLDAQDMKA